MTIDLFSSTGSKVKTLELPASLFEAPTNWGLMHQAVVRQQNNRRQSGAHAKTRAEVQGSTRKLYSQKHTGQARRGAIRSPVLRGGGKAFGPRNMANYATRMPQKMRHAALRSCLSLQAQKGAVLAIESYPDTVKTKQLADLLKKLPIEHGRQVLLVSPAAHRSLQLSARNIDGVKTVYASYLNPEDVLGSRHIIFLADAINEAEKMFGKKTDAEAKLSKKKIEVKAELSEKKGKPSKKAAKKKVTKEKTSKKSSASSESSDSSASSK
jgi:large subunit ribosomal protein L4